jgi:hypothetical protein
MVLMLACTNLSAERAERMTRRESPAKLNRNVLKKLGPTKWYVHTRDHRVSA